jgi:hypothetical protein
MARLICITLALSEIKVFEQPEKDQRLFVQLRPEQTPQEAGLLGFGGGQRRRQESFVVGFWRAQSLA